MPPRASEDPEINEVHPWEKKPQAYYKDFAVQWFLLTWLDGVCMAIVGGTAFAVYRFPVPVTRTFPITFDGSNDIVYPELAYPARGWTISPSLAGIISTSVPFAIFFLAQIRIRSAWDLSNAIMGTLWALLFGSLTQVIMKQLIGGFRPNFLGLCQPDVSLALVHNKTGLNGVGFHQIMYTIEVCTNPNRQALKTAITSFPSGHSVAFFAGFGFLFLWLNGKLKVWADHRPAFWKLTLTLIPLLGAFYMACTLVLDGAHHWYDIMAGSLIGFLSALASYRASYAAVWDWRFNHLPLQPLEAFRYGTKKDLEYAAQTFTRCAEWGINATRNVPPGH